MADEYEVGPGRPPLHTQFKKGEPSRNPKGRPRASSNLTAALEAAWLAPMTVPDPSTGRTRQVPRLDAYVEQLLSQMAHGEMKAAQILRDLLILRVSKLPVPANDIPPQGSEEGVDNAADDQIIQEALARKAADQGGGDE